MVLQQTQAWMDSTPCADSGGRASRFHSHKVTRPRCRINHASDAFSALYPSLRAYLAVMMLVNRGGAGEGCQGTGSILCLQRKLCEKTHFNTVAQHSSQRQQSFHSILPPLGTLPPLFDPFFLLALSSRTRTPRFKGRFTMALSLIVPLEA